MSPMSAALLVQSKHPASMLGTLSFKSSSLNRLILWHVLEARVQAYHFLQRAHIETEPACSGPTEVRLGWAGTWHVKRCSPRRYLLRDPSFPGAGKQPPELSAEYINAYWELDRLFTGLRWSKPKNSSCPIFEFCG